MDDRPPIPSQRVETVEVDGRYVALRAWEGEVLVRAGGWILVLRGLGLAAAFFASSLALIPIDLRVGWLFLASILLALLPAAVGLGALCRSGSCRLAALCIVMAWIALVLYAAPGLFQLGRPYEVHKLAAQPLLLMLLPAYLLPDLFAAYCVCRPDAEPAFRLQKTPLATIADAFRVRMTGRVLVATGMVSLACISAALCAFLAPGLSLL